MEKINGFIISRRKYQENILIDFLTKKGILQIVARGALKPKAKLRGSIELFDLSKLELIKGHSRFILVGGRVIKRPLFLRQSLNKTLFLMAFSQIVNTIVKDMQTQKVMHLFLLAIKKLKDEEEEKLLLLFAFCLGHLLLIEGLLDEKQGPSFHLKKDFLDELTKMSLSEFLVKPYKKLELKKFILDIKNWLSHEGARTYHLDLFLKQQKII